MTGIYAIKNLVNNKIYIGQTKDIEHRFVFHKKRLNYNKHKNKHLQSSWNKHGEVNFLFIVLELCDVTQLNINEKKWISKFDSSNRNLGYNKTHGGIFGKISDDVQLTKIEKQKQQTIPLEQRLKISRSLSGRKQLKHIVEKRAKSCRKFDDVQETEIVNLYKTGKTSMPDIATKIGCKTTLIRSILRRYGYVK